MLLSVFAKTTRDRWRGLAIGVAGLSLLLLMAMAVYRDFDLSIYDELPDVFRSIMGIAAGADAAGLAIGVLYGLYGSMTLAALSLSMGSASIAGEERDGTMGLLLGNPKSRTHVLASKAISMVLLTTLAAAVLWGAAHLVAAVLGVELGDMKVGAYSLHMLSNALFYGFLALALGAWTGKRGLASGVSAAVMVLSFLAVGIFPLIDGWQDVAKAFPWYYFDSSQPVINGVSWAHLAILGAGIVVLGTVALVGVNRRDLRSQSVGSTLVDRLRTHPRTRKLADRLAGRARVSRIWVKTASEHQGLVVVTGIAMFLIMGVAMGPLYSAMDQTLLNLAQDLPEELFAFVGAGGGDMRTPEGFYEVETFGLTAPIAIMIVAIVIGAQALAGEERRRTMGLLLANPVRRSAIVLEKSLTMVILAAVVGFATFAGVWIGSLIAGLGVNGANIAATALLATLVGLVFGAVALVLSAATGLVRVAIFGAAGAALAFHLLTSIASLSDGLAGIARWSPFNYYLTTEPLLNGMPWGHAALLVGVVVGLVALAVVLFDRRDLRQSG